MQVATVQDRLVAAVLPMLSPGRSALVMNSTPGTAPSAEGLRLCLRAACEWLAKSDVKIVQMLIEPSQTAIIEAARLEQFEELATLIYLHRPLTLDFSAPEMPRGYQLLQYNASTHARFARTILSSYQSSLDCPKLLNKRDIEDIIATHKSAGAFDPNLWFCLCEGDKDLGVLLLAPVGNGQAMELVYIGLTPEARGHGLGDWFLRLAFHMTLRHDLGVLTLAVDAGNSPALAMYYRNGLSEISRRLAMARYF